MSTLLIFLPIVALYLVGVWGAYFVMAFLGKLQSRYWSDERNICAWLWFVSLFVWIASLLLMWLVEKIVALWEKAEQYPLGARASRILHIIFSPTETAQRVGTHISKSLRESLEKLISVLKPILEEPENADLTERT